MFYGWCLTGLCLYIMRSWSKLLYNVPVSIPQCKMNSGPRQRHQQTNTNPRMHLGKVHCSSCPEVEFLTPSDKILSDSALFIIFEIAFYFNIQIIDPVSQITFVICIFCMFLFLTLILYVINLFKTSVVDWFD